MVSQENNNNTILEVYTLILILILGQPKLLSGNDSTLPQSISE